ncbi:ATP-binding protein [Chloroflexota bacterium]
MAIPREVFCDLLAIVVTGYYTIGLFVYSSLERVNNEHNSSVTRINTTLSAELRAIENFEKIAKEGRKYGVALLVISQRPSDVSTTVLSQCNNVIALRLTNSGDQLTVNKLMPESLEEPMDTLPILDIGEALVVGDAVLLPSRIRINPPTEKPLSVTIDFWQEWGKQPETPDFEKAVENMRRQHRE